jgi:hypothetical protein
LDCRGEGFDDGRGIEPPVTVREETAHFFIDRTDQVGDS